MVCLLMTHADSPTKPEFTELSSVPTHSDMISSLSEFFKI